MHLVFIRFLYRAVVDGISDKLPIERSSWFEPSVIRNVVVRLGFQLGNCAAVLLPQSAPRTPGMLEVITYLDKFQDFHPAGHAQRHKELQILEESAAGAGHSIVSDSTCRHIQPNMKSVAGKTPSLTL